MNMRSFRQNATTRLLPFILAGGVLLFVGYIHLNVFVLSRELPRTRILRRQNAEMLSRADSLQRRIDACAEAMTDLEVRDEDIYRAIFGLNSIPSSTREGGLQGANLYEEIAMADRSGKVLRLCLSADNLEKREFVQSRSYDEVALMKSTAEDMSTSIPAICPVTPDRRICYISSKFGRRRHPVFNTYRMHKGVDFAGPRGSPVYATGDAVVAEVKIERRGYGRSVLLDHGFGYKTRYGHLTKILVAEGARVKRGDVIATTGNSGISSGPHLHYEVMYKGRYVNPLNYFDRDLPVEQYNEMIGPMTPQNDPSFIHPSHRAHSKASKKSLKKTARSK